MKRYTGIIMICVGQAIMFLGVAITNPWCALNAAGAFLVGIFVGYRIAIRQIFDEAIRPKD